MIEHIARMVYYLGVHLLYASLVWLAALGLTTVIRASASTKYWIWVATSLNFVIPFGALVDRAFASHLSGARPLSYVGRFGVTVAANAAVIGAVWLMGVLLMLMRLCWRLRAECREVETYTTESDTRVLIAEGVPVEFAGYTAPAVHGLLHSRISLPEGIDRLLSRSEFNAVLLHELTHAKRRDNLIRLIHEFALCLLWFHPLMWITGSRLELYREFSCDERVIQSARGPDLVSALAKLTDPERAFLLQASAASFMSRRLARLSAPYPFARRLSTNALLLSLFAIAGVAGVYGTVAHTACCFILKR
jgi:beta-lactamase regulating signal transducer with metallopeptidase domain